MKSRREPGFAYYSESEEKEETSCRKEGRGETWHSSVSDSCCISPQIIAKSCGENIVSAASVNWSDIYFLPSHLNIDKDSSQKSNSASPSNSERSLSHRHQRRQNNESNQVQSVNNNSGIEDVGSSREGFRKNSSTRLDFLESEGYILSISSSVLTDTSDMSGADKEVQAEDCDCEACVAGNPCTRADTPAAEQGVMSVLELVVDKLDKLTDRMKGLEQHIAVQDKEIRKLKEGVNDDSERIQLKSKGKTKQDRVEEEKKRSLKIMTERLNNEGSGAIMSRQNHWMVR